MTYDQSPEYNVHLILFLFYICLRASEEYNIYWLNEHVTFQGNGKLDVKIVN